MPPNNFCWHNRWREDLRHAVSDLARCFAGTEFSSAKERGCAMCLLATLDHVLSWSVSTPNIGSSDLIDAGSIIQGHHTFCQLLLERAAFAWGAAMAPAEVEVNLESFDSHIDVMAVREVPVGFR